MDHASGTRVKEVPEGEWRPPGGSRWRFEKVEGRRRCHAPPPFPPLPRKAELPSPAETRRHTKISMQRISLRLTLPSSIAPRLLSVQHGTRVVVGDPAAQDANFSTIWPAAPPTRSMSIPNRRWRCISGRSRSVPAGPKAGCTAERPCFNWAASAKRAIRFARIGVSKSGRRPCEEVTWRKRGLCGPSRREEPIRWILRWRSPVGSSPRERTRG